MKNLVYAITITGLMLLAGCVTSKNQITINYKPFDNELNVSTTITLND